MNFDPDSETAAAGIRNTGRSQEDGPVKRFQSRARISVLVHVAVSVIIS